MIKIFRKQNFRFFLNEHYFTVRGRLTGVIKGSFSEFCEKVNMFARSFFYF